MAQVESVASEDLAREIKRLDKTDDTEDLPPSKKFKQGRLPFKPLDSCQTPQGTSPTGSKKRKLSDNESPSAKQLKTSLGKVTVKSPASECDPEVSSSSEADTSLQSRQQKVVKKINTLDRFFKPKPDSPDQAEISSTNECLTIDLTDENTGDKPEVSEDTDVTEKIVSKNMSILKVETISEKFKKWSRSNNEDEEMQDIESSVAEESSKTNDESESAEDKENLADTGTGTGMDESFVSDISVCENALKTPGKEKTTDSMLKTPVGERSKVKQNTSLSAKSPKSGSEATPASSKKRSSISDSKKKERDAMRQKFKEEKEKEREEKRLQKEKEKEEKEKERLEKKKQKDAEKMEKEKQKQEEKEKREKERLEKLKQKEEEKKMKQTELEAKMEEKKKKDEEKKQKEDEKKLKDEEKKKEEEEKMRKEEKKKSIFKGFFIQKAPTSSPPKVKESNSIFMPFELKPNMRLAPGNRKSLSDEKKEEFDELFLMQNSDTLYLKSLKKNNYKPGKSTTTWKWRVEDDDDVEVMSHDKETIEKVTHHVKFLYFHENARPPYYGTWRKPSEKLSPRNPFKQDEILFDYEVDSDDEWEEEEPGESVSSDEEEDEDKDKEKDEDEEEADGWMVPHGYLSDGEGIEDDDEIDHASKQDLQKVRQAAWESELKKQAKALRMVAIGCAWEDTTAIAAQQLETLLKYKAVCLTEGQIATSFSRVRQTDTDAVVATKAEEKNMKVKRKLVPEEAMPDLIRLIHGNPNGMQKLGTEFRMFWKMKTDPDTEVPANTDTGSPQGKDISQQGTSMEVDSTKEKGEEELDKTSIQQDDFAISKRQLEKKIQAIAVREKRPDHKKSCWYVKDEVLKQYNLGDIKMPNSWHYVYIKAPMEEKVIQKVEETAGASSVSAGRSTPNILQFAQPMSPAMILQAHGAAKDQNKSQAVTEIAKPDAPEKETAPSDQRRIKDMFSPASRKVKTTQIKGPSSETNIVSKPLKENANNTTDAAGKAESKSCTSPVLNLGSLFSVKPVSKSSNVTILIEDEEPCTKTVPGTPVIPKQAGYSVINTVLTSPELMKISPKNDTKPVAKKLPFPQQAAVEEPMETEDVIVLD